jgi:hypothetical protein|tara:strand:+ start:3898 stop:4647 length:750 start_codon:yes stop_codon:yes gene_type:complete
MNKLIKIYAERNTGTAYLINIIQLNLRVALLRGVVPESINILQKIIPGKEWLRDLYFNLTYGSTLGWEHTTVKSSDELKEYPITKNNNILFITIIKNPYSWALSLYRKPWHQYFSAKIKFEEFLQRRWVTVGRDNTKKILDNPMELWNIKNNSYSQLKNFKSLNLKTEGILAKPETTIQKIHQILSIDKRCNQFKNYEKSTRDKTKDNNYYRDYYLNEKWKHELSKESISLINKSIDMTLMKQFDYKVL